jgi:hypothetical protein
MNHLSPTMHLTSGVGDELPSMNTAAGELGGGRERGHDGGRAQAEAAVGGCWWRRPGGGPTVLCSPQACAAPTSSPAARPPFSSPAARPLLNVSSLLVAAAVVGSLASPPPLLDGGAPPTRLAPPAADSPSRARIGGGWPRRRRSHDVPAPSLSPPSLVPSQAAREMNGWVMHLLFASVCWR